MNLRGDEGAAGAETVLVVEDDMLVRLVIAAYLRDCGYRVIEAASAAEALKLLEHDDDRIAVVMTDVEMPGGMDGFTLARWVRRERPDVEVVMAGTPARAVDAAGELCEEGPVLAQATHPPRAIRPPPPSAVLDRIRRLLAMRERP